LTKPLDYDELGIAVSRVLEHFRLVQEVRSLRASLDRKYGFENIVGLTGQSLPGIRICRVYVLRQRFS
jgi:DNA-binding NtrC family response regulator